MMRKRFAFVQALGRGGGVLRYSESFLVNGCTRADLRSAICDLLDVLDTETSSSKI